MGTVSLAAIVHPSALIDHGAQIGHGTHVWHFVHVRSTAIIGANCSLGQGVYIDAGVLIGNRVKIQNGVSVYRGVTLEDEVFIGPHVVFTNDKHPRAIGPWTHQATRVCRGASLGAGAVILCGLTIGEYAMVGAGSVVTRDVEPYELVYGNPALHAGTVFADGTHDA